MKVYLVCWEHNCRQTYDVNDFKPTDKDVKCEMCGGTVISPSGKVQLTSVSSVIRTIDPEKIEKPKTKDNARVKNKLKIKLENEEYDVLQIRFMPSASTPSGEEIGESAYIEYGRDYKLDGQLYTPVDDLNFNQPFLLEWE